MEMGLSIHMGVSKPGGEHCSGMTLTGPENDAREMAALAASRGFKATVLPPEQTTRGHVAEALDAAVDLLHGGSILLVTFSGHGTQIADTDDERNYDETWCLADGEMIDDSLHRAWAKFRPGVRIVVVSDSCKSGSILSLAPRMRVATAALRERRAFERASWQDELEAPALAPPAEIADLVLPRRRSSVKIQANVLLLAACRENENALDRDGHGLFTRVLLDIWRGGFAGSYAELIRAVREAVSKENPLQHPGVAFEGTRDLSLVHGPAFAI